MCNNMCNRCATCSYYPNNDPKMQCIERLFDLRDKAELTRNELIELKITKLVEVGEVPPEFWKASPTEKDINEWCLYLNIKQI